MAREVDIAALGELLIDFTEAGYSKGGAPANLLTVASHMGYKTAFIGKVGTDMHGAFLKKTLQKEGIDTTALIEDEHYFTTLAFVEIDENGERNFSFATLEAVKTAKETGALISYDPNYRASLWKDETTAVETMKSVIPLADVMKVSDEESLLLTGAKSYEEAAEVLLSLGLKLVLVATKNGKEHVAGFHTNAIDTTGAGDSFWGGFLSRFLSLNKAVEELTGENIRACAVQGNAVACLCVQKRGGIPAIPSAEEVKAFLKENV